MNKKPYRDTVNPINPQQGLCLARSNHSISSRRTSIIKEVSNLTEIRTNWQIVVDFLDLTLLKNPVYVNIVVGISLAHYSDVAFFTFQPMYLFLLGYTKVRLQQCCNNSCNSYIVYYYYCSQKQHTLFLLVLQQICYQEYF